MQGPCLVRPPPYPVLAASISEASPEGGSQYLGDGGGLGCPSSPLLEPRSLGSLLVFLLLAAS